MTEHAQTYSQIVSYMAWHWSQGSKEA